MSDVMIACHLFFIKIFRLNDGTAATTFFLYSGYESSISSKNQRARNRQN